MNTETNHEIAVRKAAERGHADHGWLNSWHTFSFGDYHDPAHMGFRSLRVINDDRVAAGRGFGAHPHRDMEIFSYVLEGELAHKDSLGNSRILKPGQIQLMSAGRGVTHSEFNPSTSNPIHFLQIWIQPRQRGIDPGYTEWHPAPEHDAAPKVLVISPDGREGSATIQQDVDVYRIRLAPNEEVTHTLSAERGLWLHVAEGEIEINGLGLSTEDAASSAQAGVFKLRGQSRVEALLFDLV